MNVPCDWSEQWERFSRAVEEQRLAHAYIVVGPPRGVAAAFADKALLLLFGALDNPPLAHRIRQRAHPDIVWVEPQSKSRMIRVDEMRVLTHRIQQTATEGAWKVGIIVHADRLNEQAANAFLKTLEEPSGQTVLLLLTDKPDALLPTVQSRCQQFVLSRETDALDQNWEAGVLEVLRAYGGGDPMQVLTASEMLRGVLDEIKAAIETEDLRGEDEEKDRYDARMQARLREVHSQVMRLVLFWQRDLLYCVLGADDASLLHFASERECLQSQAAHLTYAIALKRIAAVEEMARRLDRNVPPGLAFDACFSAQLGRKRTA